MAFFDFLKGKNKNQETENKQTEIQEEGLQAEGLIITPLEKSEAEEDISLKISPDKSGMAVMNRAVHHALDVNEVHFQISAGGTMYGKGSLDDEEIEETEEIGEVEISEEIEEIKESAGEIKETEESIEETKAKSKEAVDAKTDLDAMLLEISKSTDKKNKEETVQEIDVTIKEETVQEIDVVIKEEAVQEIDVVIKEEAVQEIDVVIKEEAVQEIDVVINEEVHKKKGFFAKLAEGLGKTRKSILDNVDNVLGAFTKIDEDLFEELEEVLIMADLGVATTMNIIENLKARVKKERATDPKLVKGLLIEVITAILEDSEVAEENLPSPTVMLVIGVNGVGKTTTIGKLAKNFKGKGKTVLLAAADTFRAAAIEQLEVWGERAGIEVIKQQENSDPAAVVFDAVNAAKRRKTDLLICDTAGRLHNKKNLMDELKKIAKVIEREYPEAHKEIYLVLDATTGQNALQQAKLFKEVADITGIILTKLDGTAKGGIVIAIKSELNIPVRYIGVGEGIADLQEFEAKAFAKALFGENE